MGDRKLSVASTKKLLAKAFGAKMVTRRRRGEWPNELKVQAIDEAIKVGKKRPAIGSTLYSGGDDREHDTYCALGCLGLVTGVPIAETSYGGFRNFADNISDCLHERSFNGNDGFIGRMISHNDAGGKGNSTVRALKWLRSKFVSTKSKVKRAKKDGFVIFAGYGIYLIAMALVAVALMTAGSKG